MYLQLERILELRLKQRRLEFDGLKRPAIKNAVKTLSSLRAKTNFGNAREVDNILQKAVLKMNARRGVKLSQDDFLLKKDDALADPLTLLDELYSVASIREHLHRLTNMLKAARREGRSGAELLGNYKFIGNPGTGKTTIARIMGRLLSGIDVLSSATVVETNAMKMQAGFAGQTKDKVIELMTQARGGILFIDEAYGLTKGAYASEAVDALVAELTSEEHKGKTVCIVAGYKREMDAMFEKINPGLASRFNKVIHFPDWEPADCINALAQRCSNEGIGFSDALHAPLLDAFSELRSRPHWANARDADNMFRKLNENRWYRSATAAAGSGEDSVFTLQDVQKAAEEMLSTRPKGSIELVLLSPKLCFDVIVTTACDSRGRPLLLCRLGALKRSARYSANETTCSVNFILK